ncbi:MAG: hypothetical protein WCY25_07065 [Moheibacter sp.]
MSNFFLLNEAIEISDFQTFLDGMQKLNAIQRYESHYFRKHSSVYYISNYSKLFENSGQIEQLVVKYIEQLSDCEPDYVNTEEAAFRYCECNVNGFLGIDFSKNEFMEVKKISDNEKYLNWIYYHSTNLEKLKTLIPNFKFSNTFEKEFVDLADNIQNSIIDEFKKAKDRNLKTPFFPDTKIVKDVTQSNFSHKIMELRVYTPVALRVYFNELNDSVNLISIEQKSNSNQNEDIKKAHKKFEQM